MLNKLQYSNYQNRFLSRRKLFIKNDTPRDLPGDPVIKIPADKTAGHTIPSLVREQRSHILRGTVKKKFFNDIPFLYLKRSKDSK